MHLMSSSGPLMYLERFLNLSALGVSFLAEAVKGSSMVVALDNPVVGFSQWYAIANRFSEKRDAQGAQIQKSF